MKLSKIVDNIKRRFVRIAANPNKHSLNFGEFSLDITGFSFEMDECNFCNSYCDYMRAARPEATLRVQGRINRDFLPYFDCYETSSKLHTIIVEPSGIVLEGAFVRRLELSYDDGVSETFAFDMEIVASSFTAQ